MQFTITEAGWKKKWPAVRSRTSPIIYMSFPGVMFLINSTDGGNDQSCLFFWVIEIRKCGCLPQHFLWNWNSKILHIHKTQIGHDPILSWFWFLNFSLPATLLSALSHTGLAGGAHPHHEWPLTTRLPSTKRFPLVAKHFQPLQYASAFGWMPSCDWGWFQRLACKRKGLK